jgi:hypothetical protein
MHLTRRASIEQPALVAKILAYLEDQTTIRFAGLVEAEHGGFLASSDGLLLSSR